MKTVITENQLSAEIARALRLLLRHEGVHRVWLFGSAARGGRLDFRSDLDFAVEGLAEPDLGRAWSELDENVKLPVDLVRWERAGPTLRAQIVQRGKLL